MRPVNAFPLPRQWQCASATAFLALALTLACGGGSSSSAPTPTPAPAPAPAPAPTPGLVFTKYVGSSADLWFAPADGSPAIALADSPDQETFIQASADRVLYWRVNGTQYTLCSVKRDGSARAVLASGLSDSWGFRGVLDGRAIVYQGGTPEKVISVVLDGTAPLTLGEGPGLNPTLLDNKLFIGTTQDNTYTTGSLITIKADGTGRVVLQDVPAYATISANGKVFALGMSDQEHAYLANLDGTGRQDLGLSRLSRTGWYNWDNATERCFLSGDKVYAALGYTATSTWAIVAFPLATGVPETVISGPAPQYLWTVTGGRTIASSTPDNGNTGTLLTVDPASHLATPFPTQGLTTRFAMIFQGKVIYTDQTSSTWTDVTLKAANPDATAAVTVALAPLHTLSDLNDSPLNGRFLSSTSDRLVFRKSVSGQSEVCSALVDGTSPKTVSQGSGPKHLEAVVGNVLVYRAVNNNQGDLFAVNADGTGHILLTNAPEDEAFVVMMGQNVVFSRKGLDGTVSYYTVPLTGGTPKLLVATGAASAWGAAAI